MSVNEEAWRDAPPPAPAPQQPMQAQPQSRDLALAIGDPLYRLVMVVWRIPLGFVLLLAGWGISVPAIILRRTAMPQAFRLALAAVVFAGWVALIVSQA